MGHLLPDHLIFGQTKALRQIRREILQFAGSDLPIVIEGESGTGKEALARWIHAHSARQSGPFVKVHCPALPSMQLEGNLIGYELSAAIEPLRFKPGRLEEARVGTLFLDGISELSADSQASLLRLLQDGRFTRIGGSESQPVRARLLCSTRASLASQVAASAFRKDLYYRLNVVEVRVPPLRRRLQDVPEIAAFMLDSIEREYGASVPPLSPELIQLMRMSPWPGNIRQLENVIKRYVVLGGDAEGLTSELLNQMPLRGFAPASNLKKTVRQQVHERERNIILRALHSHHWNRKEAARALGISYQGLLYKMRQANLFQEDTAIEASQRHNAALPAHQPSFVH